MSMDWTGLITGAVSVYLLWQQNQIFKQQNEIFAAQGGKMVPAAKSSAFRRYWPMLVMLALTVTTLIAVTYLSANKKSLPNLWLDRFLGFVVGIASVKIGASGLRLVSRVRKRNLELSQASKGFLDYKLQAETAMGKLPSIINKLTAMMSSIAPKMAGQAARITAAQSTAEHLKIAKAAARTLDTHSLQVELLLVRLTAVANFLAEGLNEWSKWVHDSKAKNPEVVSFAAAMRILTGTMQSSMKQIQGYIDSIAAVSGMSQALNASVDRHVRCMQAVQQALLTIYSAYSESLVRLETLT